MQLKKTFFFATIFKTIYWKFEEIKACFLSKNVYTEPVGNR